MIKRKILIILLLISILTIGLLMTNIKVYANEDNITSEPVLNNGIYEITSAINGRQAFDVTDGLKDDGVLIQLWQQDGFQQQRFEVIYEEGFYIIKAMVSNKVLSVEGDSLVQTTKTGKDTEKWIIEEKGNNQYSVKSKYNGKYINVKDGDVKNGVKLNIEEKQESNAQKFNFNDKTIRGTKTIEDGIYTISSGLDNDKLFDVTDGKKEEGTPIQIWQRDGFEQQLFEIEYKGEGYYTIKSKLSNKILTLKDEEVKNGTQIIQTEEKGEDREKWIIKNEGNNEYSIISKIGNYYIDVPGADIRNGVKMQVYQGNNNKAQRYKFTNREPMVGTKTVEEGRYTIASKIDANKMFDITSGSREDGAEVQLWQEDWFIQQEYELKYNEDGYYTIYARVSGKVLSVENKSVMDGTKIVQKTSTGADEEKWIIKNNGDGTYSIISKINNYYIDVPGADAKNGTKLNMHDGNGTNAQKFILSRIVPEKGSQTVEDSTYRIISPIDDKKAFDIVDGKSEAGTKIQIWDNDGFTQQKFNMEYIGEGYYKIRSKLSNKVLTVESEIPEYNSEITQEEDKNLDTQKWIIKELGNGLYNIISKCENLYLTIESNPQNGQRVKLDRKNNTNRQQFILINETPKQGISTGIADGIYQLKLKNGMVLDVNGASYDNYGNIQIWSNDYAQQKKFRITRVQGTNYYKITAVHSAKAMDVENGGIDIGTNVGQYEQNGTDNQYWYLKDLGNGYYNIISKANGLCLDIAGGMTTNNGTNVQLYYSNNSDAQQFKIEYSYIINNDTYEIEPKLDSTKVLDVAGASTADFGNVQLWQADNVNHQRFILEAISSDTYVIRAKNSYKALTLDLDNHNVYQFTYCGSANQQWKIQELGNGYYNIISNANGLYLDVNNANAQNGENIWACGYTGSDAQRFRFVTGFRKFFEQGSYGKSGLAIKGDWRGTDLKYYKYGKGNKVLFATFSIHGFEDSYDHDGAVLTYMANEFKNYLDNSTEEAIFNKWTIYIFPNLNPDGQVYGWTKDGPGRTTLYSAAPGNKGIDMNRNWAANGESYVQYYNDRNYNGTAGFQAYEARALRDFLLSHQRDQNFLVDTHGWLNYTIGDYWLSSYYRTQFGMSNDTHVYSYGRNYLDNWARMSLYNARSTLVELPQVWSQSQAVSWGYAQKYINATTQLLREN